MRKRPFGFSSGALLLLACAGPADETDSGTVGLTFEPIIGGVVATDYPEAAGINMDAISTSMHVCSGTLIASVNFGVH